MADALPCLGRDPDYVAGGAAQDPGQLGSRPVRLGRRQVDLVDDGDDLEPGLDRHVGIGQGLSLDSLGGIDHQKCSLAGR